MVHGSAWPGKCVYHAAVFSTNAPSVNAAGYYTGCGVQGLLFTLTVLAANYPHHRSAVLVLVLVNNSIFTLRSNKVSNRSRNAALVEPVPRSRPRGSGGGGKGEVGRPP